MMKLDMLRREEYCGVNVKFGDRDLVRRLSRPSAGTVRLFPRKLVTKRSSLQECENKRGWLHGHERQPGVEASLFARRMMEDIDRSFYRSNNAVLPNA